MPLEEFLDQALDSRLQRAAWRGGNWRSCAAVFERTCSVQSSLTGDDCIQSHVRAG